MSWFGNGNSKRLKVRKTISRLLNTTTSLASHLTIDADTDQRDDLRVGRITPVVLLPLSGDSSEDNLNLGLTRDLSSEGMAISTLGSIAVGERLAIGIGKDDDFAVLLGECVRSEPIGYGFFESGVNVLEVLPSHDFMPLKNFAHFLEGNPPKSLIELLDKVDSTTA